MKKSVPVVSAVALLATLASPSRAAEISGGGGKAGHLIPFDRAPVHPPKDTPEAATKNLAKAKIPQGFTADIWASEPLLANPVAFCFDGKGRVFVSETHRYRSSVLDIRHYYWMVEDDLATRNQDDWMASIKKNFPNDWHDLEKESEVIRLVQDSNGDGKADQSSVYADGFNTMLDGIASGVLWDNGSLYFANIPALWKLSGQDKAEKRDALFHGFGIRFSYTGHDFHGLIKGPDGRIYMSIGDRAASVKTKEGTTIELPDEGGVFRCEPDGSHLELVMKGLRNPQELAFDDYGNLFTGDNDSDQGDRERWVYIVEGGDAGWRIGYQHHPLGKAFNPWLAEHQWEPRDPKKGQPAYVLSPIANLPDGPSGLAYYPGTGLPAEFAGSYFLAGYKGSTAASAVSTFKSVPNGASFKLEGLHTFIGNVQATDVAFGPDSRFYVSAWDEGWERSDQGRIYRLSNEEARKAQAAQIAEVQKILGEGFAQRSNAELAKLLGHPDQRVRLGAQWALSEKKDVAQQFAEVALKGKGLARLHGIWGIGNEIRKGGAGAAPVGWRQIFKALIKDPDAEVRAQTVHVVSQLDPLGMDRDDLCLDALKDPNARVRFFAAMGLAHLEPGKGRPVGFAGEQVVRMLKENDGQDEYLQHAGVMALVGMKNAQVLAAAAKDQSRSIRLAALLAYRRLGSEQVAQFLTDKDASLVSEAAHAINDAPIPAALPALASFASQYPAQDPRNLGKDPAFGIRVLNANFRVGDAASARRLADVAAVATHEELRLAALEMLEHWATPPARDYVLGIYRPLPKRDAVPAAQALGAVSGRLLGDKSEKIVIATCEALAANGAKSSGAFLLAVVKDTKAPGKARLAALDALSKLGASELSAALDVASADADGSLKTEATKLLGKSDPAAGAKQLLASYPKAPLAEQKQILNALGDNPSPEAGQGLAALVADFAKVAPAAQVELLEAAAKRPEAKDALAKYEASLPKDDKLAKFLPALAGGDAAAGEKLFKEHPVAACLRCHKVGGQGGDAGPVLDGIATRKDRHYVLQSIVDVNAVIADGFQMVVLTMNDGNAVAGFLKKENDAEVTIQVPGEPATKTLKKADIKQRDTAPSGMLPNLADLLTPRELRDIIEYAATLK